MNTAAIAVKEKPILFSGPMVQAILDGRKTMTRRVMKPIPYNSPAVEAGIVHADGGVILGAMAKSGIGDRWICPYGAPGDRLWVRELLRRNPNTNCWHYAADDTLIELPPDSPHLGAMYGWAHHKEGDVCVSIHMPRWASRITLELTEVRAERLQEITTGGILMRSDVVCEGSPRELCGDAQKEAEWFISLWDSINAKTHSFDSNPWVWALTFRRLA